MHRYDSGGRQCIFARRRLVAGNPAMEVCRIRQVPNTVNRLQIDHSDPALAIK